MNENFEHVSVLKEEAVSQLQVAPKRKYIDGTLGGGGHCIEIVRCGGEVLGIDQDRTALSFARRRILHELPAAISGNSVLVYGNFRNVAQIAKQMGFAQVDGILLDLGMSSFHIDGSRKGFSYRFDEPLDMRMDSVLSEDATDLLNTASVDTLYEIFTNFGEQQRAQELADHIERTRSINRITSSKQLREIIEEVFGEGRIEHEPEHLARTFQAIRIAVNDELDALRECLEAAIPLLKSQGRIVVISFHSLEDRIVKLFLRESKMLHVLTKKSIRPSDNEIMQNRRARSARLRVAQKI